MGQTEIQQLQISASLAKFVIPSNHKWFRDLAVSHIITRTLEDLNMKLPKPTVDISDIRRRYHEAAALAKPSAERKDN